MNKQYLGDSVYAEIRTDRLILTTENGTPYDPSNIIVIEQEVWSKLKEYMESYEAKTLPTDSGS